jgi:hypothetical protein
LQTIEDGQDVIAGKTYEYLAARKPIVAVVATQGGDAWLMRETGAGEVVSYDSPERVAHAMKQQWEAWKRGDERTPADIDTSRFSRRNLTQQLASLFDDVLSAST